MIAGDLSPGWFAYMWFVSMFRCAMLGRHLHYCPPGGRGGGEAEQHGLTFCQIGWPCLTQFQWEAVTSATLCSTCRTRRRPVFLYPPPQVMTPCPQIPTVSPLVVWLRARDHPRLGFWQQPLQRLERAGWQAVWTSPSLAFLIFFLF